MRKHRFWLRNQIKYHSVHGEYYTFFRTVDDETFQNSYRVSRSTFHELHFLVQPYIQKQDSIFRNSISSGERLAVFKVSTHFKIKVGNFYLFFKLTS